MTQVAGLGRVVRADLAGPRGVVAHRRFLDPRRPWLCHGLFVTLLLAIGGVHLAILTMNGEPSGLDFGNWLTIGHHILGQGARGGSQSIYPPVVPILSVAAVSLFGVPWGPAIVAALAGLVPAGAVYWVLHRSHTNLAAVSLGALIAAAGSTGEAVAWGGAPQLIGLGSGLLAVWFTASMLRSAAPGDAWRAGIAVLATAATSHLELAQATLTICVVVIIHLTVAREGMSLRGPWLGRKGNGPLVLRVVGPSLVLMPLYGKLLTSVGESFVTQSSAQGRASAFFSNLGNLFNDSPTWWRAATVVAVMAPLVAWRQHKEPLWAVTVALLVTTLGATAYTAQIRLAYVLPLGIACGVGLLILATHALVPQRVTLVPALALCVLCAIALNDGLRYFPQQRTFYGDRIMPRGTVAALSWVRDQTPSNAVIAVAPVYGEPFGWWVEGLTRRPTLTGSLEEFLNFPDERRRAELAVSLFSMTDAPVTTLLASAHSMRADYLFVPAAWNGLGGSTLEQLIDQRPDCVVFRNAAALVVKVPK